MPKDKKFTGQRLENAMVIKKFCLLFLSLVILIPSSVSLLLAGCSITSDENNYVSTNNSNGEDSSTANGRYRKFTLRNGSIHYAFEYPVSYKTQIYDPYEFASKPAGLQLTWTAPESKVYSIFIGITSYNIFPNVEACIELFHDKYLDENMYTNFVITDRTTLKIAGIAGEQLTSLYDLNLSLVKDVPTPEILREAYFEYQGFIWRIDMTASENVSEIALADFDHLIKTFRFLKHGGCEEYETFYLENKRANFSFQYPTCYENDLMFRYSGLMDKETNAPVELEYPDVSLVRYSEEDGDWVSWFLTYANDLSSDNEIRPEWCFYSDLNDAIAADTSYLSEKHDIFEILERSSVSVSDIQAEQIICAYTYSEYHDFYHAGLRLFGKPLTSRMVYFKHDGLIWKIWMASVENVVDEDKAYFRHILETFKILD